MPADFLDELTGSFAQPARENPTVEMVEAAYRHHDLPWRYVNCEVAPADLGDAVRGARAMGWRGFNCSIPHKVAVIEHLDRLGESAAIIGAVNTVVRRDGDLVGENTDGKGFVEALRAVRAPAGLHVEVLGAGGAARAIAVELGLAGAAHVTIVNRTHERGAAVAALVGERTPATAAFVPWDATHRVAADADLLVNATSIGLHPDVEATPDLDHATLTEDLVVADVIPNPPRTRLLQVADERGCTTVDGLGMLVGQGVLAVRYWTGVDVDPAVMRRALLDLDLARGR